MKDVIYKEKPQTITELKQVIMDKFIEVSLELGQKACRSILGRVQTCIEHHCEHFENCF